jgi:hypothetical protein
VPRKATAPPKELPLDVALDRFLESATTEIGARDHVELSSHLYAAFRRWCSQKRIKAMGASAFGRELGKADFEATRLSSSRAKAWRGICLRPRWKKIAEEETARLKAACAPRSVPIVCGRKLRKPKALVRTFLTYVAKHDRISVEPTARLFEEHLRWCRYTDHCPLRRPAFGKALKAMGLEPVRLGNGRQRAWRGYRLLSDHERHARLERGYSDWNA